VGVLIRKVSISSRARAGDIVGSTHKASGYRVISVDGVVYREHVLIWFMLHGEWLSRLIDHEDRNRGNNRPDNLSKAMEAQQRQNTALRRDNRSGYRGASLHACGKARARVMIDGKEMHLGLFSSIEDAAAARQADSCLSCARQCRCPGS
jgi:hypothetical protein